ncbi:hypothetical protein M5K25_025004 [Dendrobium thyrsiflorum]|uniref:Thioredoxin domain-containing protein n=1 Tax=Dendrobium thyrsiflorum TaxID=117978 RepID=A0ABD0U7W7_DENTH
MHEINVSTNPIYIPTTKHELSKSTPTNGSSPTIYSGSLRGGNPWLLIRFPGHSTNGSIVVNGSGSGDVDHGFLYDDQGRVDILGSPFFDIEFGNDRTADEYVDRIIYQSVSEGSPKLAVEYEDKVLFIKVDTDDEYELAQDMQVRGLPTLYFISPDPNKNAIRTEGLIPREMIKNIIDNEM